MLRSTKHRVVAMAVAGAALLISATPSLAAGPTVETFSVHREVPFVDCPGFGTVGEWDITHRLTTFYDASGVPLRDIDRVDFAGAVRNADTGASVADSGGRIFFDTLAPDGSILTTYSIEVRHSDYLHVAGRRDWQTGTFTGVNRFDDAGIAALCAALGG